jgi:hypothetical protein
MTDNEALDILRALGHAAAAPDRNRWVRVWIHGYNDTVDVKDRKGTPRTCRRQAELQ